MQFIPDGPDIPEALLEAHEEGRVVFFCGAGISYPAGLPTFWGLVTKVYETLGEEQSAIEAEALKSDKYDTTLGLLEQRLRNGRHKVREAIAQNLEPNLTHWTATKTHKALLTLSKNRMGATKLITTNFDRVFEEVIKGHNSPPNTYTAPLLPVPKNRWDGIIYLHGRLDDTCSEANFNNLVATSGDFGLAYLIERWASRFVSELFRNYTVCFVGYSINDPILRYMMDALAADSMMGEENPVAYAFGSFKEGEKGNVANEWKTKNVVPILYKETPAHSYLHKTLHTWANNYRDGVNGKSSIVTRYAHNKPTGSTKQDDFVKRMIWALSDGTGLPAKTFAKIDPAPPIEWLSEFSTLRFGVDDLPRFDVPKSNNLNPEFKFSLLSRPSPSHLASHMSLVDRGGSNTSQWDRVMEELAKWLMKHLDKPEVLFWVIGQGNALNPRFERYLKNTLEDDEVLTPPMQKLWGYVVSGYVRLNQYNGSLYDWAGRFKNFGNTPIIRHELKNALRPSLKLSRPYSIGSDPQEGTNERISAIANVEIALASDHVHSAYARIQKNVQFSDFLPHVLTDMSELLSETLDLMCDAEISSVMEDYSYIQLPSISDHNQNKDYHDWTLLVTLCRDAWLANVENDPETARAVLTIWISSKHPVLRRLAFFALAQKPNLVPLEKSISWLLSENGHWLWATSTMRETLRLLVSLGPQLTENEGKRLQEAIIQGPARTRSHDDISEDDFRNSADRKRWLRLKKLLSEGGEATEATLAVIKELEEAHPLWKLASDERDEFPVWTSNGEDIPVEQSPKKVKDLVEWLRSNPTPEGILSGDNWPERCRDDFRRSVSALLKLADEDVWVPQRWSEALNAWSNGDLNVRSWKLAAPIVATMPDDQFAKALHSITWWINQVSRNIQTQDEHFFRLIDRIIELGSNCENVPDGVSINHAINHPVGRAASSLLNWWFSTELEDNQGLPGEIRTRFSQMCNADNQGLWLGSVMLAQQVIPLFRVDPEWTEMHLIPAFHWDADIPKAAAMWDSFLHAPRIYHPLLEKLKKPFLEVPEHFDDLDQQCSKQYASFLTYIALGKASAFSSAELKNIIANLPSKHLKTIARTLFNAVQGAGGQKTEYLENRVKPFVRNFWPNNENARFEGTFRYFAQICAISGAAFESTFTYLKDHLGPVDHFGYLLNLLSEANLAANHPENVLAILDATMPVDVQHLDGSLGTLLDAIKAANANLVTHAGFTRLSVLSQQHEN